MATTTGQKKNQKVLETIYCNVLNVCKLLYIPYANFGVYAMYIKKNNTNNLYVVFIVY